MQLVQDFYNKVKEDLKSKYFPQVKFYRDDKNCEVMCYNLELFNNGCLRLSILINRVVKNTDGKKEDITSIIKKYLVD